MTHEYAPETPNQSAEASPIPHPVSGYLNATDLLQWKLHAMPVDHERQRVRTQIEKIARPFIGNVHRLNEHSRERFGRPSRRRTKRTRVVSYGCQVLRVQRRYCRTHHNESNG